MPSKSKSQQRLMGMVHAYQKGDLDLKDLDKSLADKIREIAKGIKKKDAKDFAETKHKGLPEVKESIVDDTTLSKAAFYAKENGVEAASKKFNISSGKIRGELNLINDHERNNPKMFNDMKTRYGSVKEHITFKQFLSQV